MQASEASAVHVQDLGSMWNNSTAHPMHGKKLSSHLWFQKGVGIAVFQYIINNSYVQLSSIEWINLIITVILIIDFIWVNLEKNVELIWGCLV